MSKTIDFKQRQAAAEAKRKAEDVIDRDTGVAQQMINDIFGVIKDRYDENVLSPVATATALMHASAMIGVHLGLSSKQFKLAALEAYKAAAKD